MTSPPSRRSLTRSLAPLRERDFALFELGWATTRFGTAVQETGALWLAYQMTGSPGLLGLLGLVRAVPAITLGPLAGAVADRVDQRRLLIATQTLGGLASLVVGLLVVTGAVELLHLYVLVGVESAVGAFDGSARVAFFPRLVPPSTLPEAVTMNATSSRLAQLVGPVVGGLTIAGLGEAAPFLLNAATFLGLIALVPTMRPAALVDSSGPDTLSEQLWEGMRYVAGAPVLRGLLLLEVVVGVVEVNSVIVTVFAREVIDTGPEGLGLLLAAPAFGSLFALVGVLVLGQARRQGRFVLMSGLGYAALLVVLSTTRLLLLAVATLALIGLLDGLMMVTRHTVMQLTAPGRMRGRVMGLMGTITRGTGPLGEMQSGWVCGLVGPAVALAAAATVLAAATAGTALTNRQLWAFHRLAGAPDHDEDRPTGR